MTGRISVIGTGPEHWYHAGRDHTFFTIEADLHHGSLAALALPPSRPGCAIGSPANASSRSPGLNCSPTTS